jgi:hypothetical protein
MNRHEFKNLSPDDYRIERVDDEWFLQVRMPSNDPDWPLYQRDDGDHFWENDCKVPATLCENILRRELLLRLLLSTMNNQRRLGHYQGRRAMAGDIGALIKLGD